VKHGFGFVRQTVRLRIVGKLVGTVNWYFDYHDATLWKTDLAQYLPKLRHSEENSGRRGEGRVSSFNIRLLGNELYNRGTLWVVHNWTVLEIKWAVSRIGNKLQRPAISILALVVVLLAILPHSWMHTETTDEHLD
jgi:hypothetical protein